jgi:hypothetical protein
MTEEMKMTSATPEKKEVKIVHRGGGGGSGGVYGIGLIGAWVFYFQRAKTPRDYAIGFFKAFAWPAFLVYEFLKYINKEPSA